MKFFHELESMENLFLPMILTSKFEYAVAKFVSDYGMIKWVYITMIRLATDS